ncbi:hypothetical protein ADUPG1_005414, partial [Aduncisulcus paluster]
ATIAYSKAIPITKSILRTVGGSRARSFFKLLQSVYPCSGSEIDPSTGYCSHEVAFSHIPITVTAERDIMDHNVLSFSLPLHLSTGECLGILTMDVSMAMFDSYLYKQIFVSSSTSTSGI